MIKEDNSNNSISIMELTIQPVRRKISRKTNLKLFAIIVTIAIASGLGGVLYSIISSSSYYHNKNPWANAILLDDKITKMVNSQLSKALIDLNGVAKQKSLTSYVHFNVGETENIDIYANLTNSQVIQDIFEKDNWIKNNLSIVETMLLGTGASLSGTQVIYQGKLLNLILRPKILDYPYSGDDKYGLVTVIPVDYQQGLFTYKVRFALQLIATDFAGYYIDLKKTFDYTWNHAELFYPTVLTLSQILNLISNQKIINLVQKYDIRLDSSNELILNSLLKEYYPIAISDNSIIINEEIINKNGIPFAPLNGEPFASDLTLNIKYDSKKINSLQQFGANLFNYHSKNYSSIANIFTKIGIKMPTFENVKNNYDLYDRNSENTFLADAMIDKRVNSYLGFIKEMGVSSDNIADNFNYVTYDDSQYVWGSEHQIFYNEVKIKFLNINNNLADNIYRSPTKIYYDQQSYADNSINFQVFNLSASVKDVIEKIQYDDFESKIDQQLTNQTELIKASLKDYLLKQLNDPHIKFNNIVKGITVGVTNNVSRIQGTVFEKKPPINGSYRGNANKVYQDKLLTFPKIVITVQFSYDGTSNNIYNLFYEYDIMEKVIKDLRGVDKNNLNVLQNNFSLSDNYITNYI